MLTNREPMTISPLMPTWALPPPDFVLSKGIVHIWRASLNNSRSHLQQIMQVLSPDELKQAERCRTELMRERFIASRGILRGILGQYLDTEPSRLRFAQGRRGKPFLIGKSQIRFNFSHAHGLILYAVSLGREMGIDLEYLHPTLHIEGIAHRILSDREKPLCSTFTQSEMREMFFSHWVCKESYLKATGEGLSQPMNQIEVSLRTREPVRFLSIKGDDSEASRWSLRCFAPHEDYVAALTVKYGNILYKYFQWPEEANV